jgi:transcriptional regulator with XRE-family HTH domain
MERNAERLRWPELIRELIGLSNMSQLARDLRVSSKEVKRWWTGERRPDGENAQAIIRFCENDGKVNWRLFQGLSPVYDFGKSFERNVAEGPRGLQITSDLW